MLKHLVAITIIFCGASLAWLILGATLAVRTTDSDSSQRARLSAQWGSAQVQEAPRILTSKREVIPIRSSRIDVRLDLEQRRKGLLWYNLYNVGFLAHYTLRNNTSSRHLILHLPLPSSDASYEDLVYSIGGRQIDNATVLDQGKFGFDLDPGHETAIDVGYRSRGMESWLYRFKDGIESVKNFQLTMSTNFSAIDFPPQTLLPVTEEPFGNGYRLRWKYATLVTGNGVGMAFPTPMQPGPLAQRITLWAPVALLFYTFVMLVIVTLHGIDLHPINYFLLACAFFAFHLLFAYLVDRIPLEAAFLICSCVSLFLTITYLQLVVGLRFAAVENGLAQLVYLILFSYALFNEGWSGLTITTGAIITLFVAMQLTGRIRWDVPALPQAESG